MGIADAERTGDYVRGRQARRDLSLRVLYFWLYGLVEPLTGEHFFEQYDHLNSENFQHFIHQFAARYPDEFVVIQMDKASAHRAHEID